MRTSLLLLAAVILLFVIPLGASAQEKYVPKASEERYGTWINEKAQPQKTVITSDGWKDYFNASDPIPWGGGTEQIVSKWIDAKGGVWYKVFHAISIGDNEGQNFQTLEKISKSGTVRELILIFVGDFDSRLFPKQLDPTDSQYYVYYRAKE